VTALRLGSQVQWQRAGAMELRERVAAACYSDPQLREPLTGG